MTDKKKSRTQEFDPVWQGAKKKPDYDVGYGKPPKNTRFQKGKSGNPRGRPKKLKPRSLKLSDAPSEHIFEEEIYRLVKLRENGEEISLPTLQAIRRSQIMSAIKGIQKYQDLPKRERLSKITRDWAHLERTRPPNRFITPEIQRELDRISKEWLCG